MKFRLMSLAALAAAMVFASSSATQAAYSYTLSEMSLTPLVFTVGLTKVTFDPTVLPASASTISDFNVADVGAESTQSITTPDSGTSSFTEIMKLTDTLGNTETFSLTGTIRIVAGSVGGIATLFTGQSINVISGSGFAIDFVGYSAPTAGQPATGLSGGALSIVITPTAVPEPASIAMLGLGLVSVGGLALRRRMAK